MPDTSPGVDDDPASDVARHAVSGTTSAAVAALRWLIGASLLATVVVAALHFSEGREFARLIEQASPWWLLAAVSLQAMTYLAQAEVFRSVPAELRNTLPRGWSYRLSLAKLFADQAVPSAGLSGTAVLAAALRARGISRPTTAAVAIVTIASYHTAYVICLLIAMSLATALGLASPVIVLTSGVFLAFSVGLTTTALALAGRGELSRLRVARWKLAREIVSLLADADPALARRPATIAAATSWQLAIFLLDAATMWTLIRALGATAPAGAVFTSLIIASVFRTMSIVPGGLGAYEAASVITLKLLGIDVSVALSATLLFRGLSFWLPMLPGFWYSRRLLAGGALPAPPVALAAYWTLSPAQLFDRLGSRDGGLSEEEAAARLRAGGPNRIRARHELSRIRTLAAQVRSPLLLLLLFAAAVSITTGAWADAAIVLVIVAATVGVGYAREYSAQAAAAALERRLQTLTTAVRLGQPTRIPVEEIVPGDVVQLYAGSMVPGDGMVLEATDFFVTQAVLTGESFPVEKRPAQLPGTAAVAERSNCVFLGTSVQSGTARCLVVRTGLATEFGAIAARLNLARPDTAFDRGIRRFGYLLMIAMLTMVLLVFAVHVLNGRPPVEMLLFSVALAVGLSPELLPAILTINLARGARAMARKGVLVRRLNAIENLGSMDILCTDKTGTLTEGVVNLDGGYDPAGQPSVDVLHLGAINALLETGLRNPLDDAILAAERPDRSTLEKLSEVPFDFRRKRISVIVRRDGVVQLITKGAFQPVLDVCTSAGGVPLDATARQTLIERHNHWAAEGIRVLAVAVRALPSDTIEIGRDAEADMHFAGYLTFLDRPKASAAAAIRDMAKLGVGIKLITGDARLVAAHVAALVGMRHEGMLTGQDLREMDDAALWHAAECTDVFAEVDPGQKERIIRALGRTGHVVGFLGDGVNDAPAMHAADTSLSVEGAADVARESADFVLLERDLDVIRQGIEAGRRTFANTEKYILTTTSANLGNMASMAVASLVLPFLPLTAGQILLNNFLSDIPAIGIAGDGVDPELVAGPRRWNLRFIGLFMVEFGVLSSVFDVLTFATLLVMFKSPVAMFRTGWFVESLLTELAIALVVRTRRPFFRSRPGSLLAILTGILIAVAFVLPYLPGVGVLGFVPLPARLVATLVAITASYVAATEFLKRSFFGHGCTRTACPSGRFSSPSWWPPA